MTMKQTIIMCWDKCRTLVKDNTLILSLVFIYVLFYQFWEKLIGNHLINKFFCYFEPSPLNDFIFIFACIGCIAIGFYSKERYVSQRTKLIGIISILFWAYYRYFCKNFGSSNAPSVLQLESLTFFDGLKYVDIIPVFALSKFIPHLLIKHRSSYKYENYLIDTPILSMREDLLRRRASAIRAINKILQLDASIGGLTFGIDMPMGSGKTSFMNMMKEQIDQLHLYDSIIIMDFNPWLRVGNYGLVSYFLDELGQKIRPYNIKPYNTLSRFSKTLSSIGITETNVISALLEQLSFQYQQSGITIEEITKILCRIKKRVFVFIDDMDKLKADEILEMLKLISNFSNSSYMIIIAAFDKSYMISTLKPTMPNVGVRLLDEVFPRMIPLEPFSNHELRELLVHYIDSLSLLPEKEEKKMLYDYILNDDNKNPLTFISTISEVKRLVKQFSSSCLVFKGGDINYIDLLLFDLIKSKYPEVFIYFKQHLDEVLVFDNSSEYYMLYHGTDDKNHVDFIDYLRNNLGFFKVEYEDVRLIETILDIIFSKNVNNAIKVFQKII